MSDLIFYTNPMSRGRIVRWMLEEVGEPYETRLVEWDNKSADFLAANPMGKVPTIIHRGRVVTEAAAICAYLADMFPAAALAPDDTERADYYRWMFFAAGPLEAAMADKALGVAPNAEQQGMVGYGTLDRVADTLDQAVQAHPYIAGQRFTAADVYVGSALHWATLFGTIAMRPSFEEYLGRIQSRPAAVRAVSIDDALLPDDHPAKAG